ncbi:uncharacterized protein LOC144620962 [Crassostrea virginica]
MLLVLVAMIDSIGGSPRTNNFLTTLDLPSISHKNLKAMERRAGQMIEDYAEKSMANATKVSFDTEMKLISTMEESNASFIHHDTFDEELGTAVIDDEFLGKDNLRRHGVHTGVLKKLKFKPRTRKE